MSILNSHKRIAAAESNLWSILLIRHDWRIASAASFEWIFWHIYYFLLSYLCTSKLFGVMCTNVQWNSHNGKYKNDINQVWKTDLTKKDSFMQQVHRRRATACCESLRREPPQVTDTVYIRVTVKPASYKTVEPGIPALFSEWDDLARFAHRSRLFWHLIGSLVVCARYFDNGFFPIRECVSGLHVAEDDAYVIFEQTKTWKISDSIDIKMASEAWSEYKSWKSRLILVIRWNVLDFPSLWES